LSTTFKSILCGVEGNPASTEAARQAITLAGAGADLQFTAVYTSFELGPDSKEHDLLVIGTHHNKRTSGLLFGSTATEAAHGVEGPLLVARHPPGDERFPQHILLATDGLPGSWEPVRAAAGLAATFDADVELVHVPDGKHGEASDLDDQVAEVGEATGREPGLAKIEGHAAKAIVEAAKEKGASLIVAGRRRQRGIKPLGSVSERIVGGAECSVLLIPVGNSN
jgi:nucleotide-binding universal stress UspA family protein